MEMEKSIYDKNFKFEVDIKPQQVTLPRLPIKNDIFERVEDIRGDFKERRDSKDTMCGILPNGYRCKKCGSVNVELECDTNGYYVKCEECSHYVGGKNAKEALKNWERDEDEE